MFHFKIILVAVLIACVVSGEKDDKDKDGKDKKGGKHHEKMKQCHQQTKDLEKCCPMEKDEEMKNDPECKSHLEGIETKEGKEKHKAYNCFIECIFKKNGILSDSGEVDKEKLKEQTTVFLTKTNELEFQEITHSSVDYCIGKFDEKKEKWSKWAAEKNITKKTDNGEKKCNRMVGGLMGCIMGNVVRNCPESKWQATAECEALKANVTSTDDCMKH